MAEAGVGRCGGAGRLPVDSIFGHVGSACRPRCISHADNSMLLEA